MKFLIYSIFFWCFFLTPQSLAKPHTPGQMIITGFYGQYPSDPAVKKLKTFIDQKKIGGIILFGRNINHKAQLTTLVQYLKKDTAIFVAIDHEGGLVNRLIDPSFQLNTPSPYDFCNLTLQHQESQANKVSNTLKTIGINMNFGGVVDIQPMIYPSSICKDQRCYSSSDTKISKCTAIMMAAHFKNNLYFALKHFPGHGSTSIDSHYSLPDITLTHSDYDYMPYHHLLDPNSTYDMVMVGHLLDKNIDEKYPASLSKKHINILKKQLHFDGLIVTDDLNMNALHLISKHKPTLAKMAASAGNDLLLFGYLSFNDIDSILNELSNASKMDVTFHDHMRSSLDKINLALDD
tara:strand:+ start:5551 stop:6597 length:1047 start_codon:yes stop_codon:yes gene_type:complete